MTPNAQKSATFSTPTFGKKRFDTWFKILKFALATEHTFLAAFIHGKNGTQPKNRSHDKLWK